MSVEDPSKRYGGPRPPPAYQYPPQDNSRSMAYPAPPPSLPPMSSLLRHEHMGQPEQQPYQQAPHSFQRPHFVETRHPHPLYHSETNPSAPVQYIYHAPQEHAYISEYRAEPVLVPIRPAIQPARPERVPIPQLPQRRQSRKIGQRRDELEKDYVDINRSLAAEPGHGSGQDYSSGSQSQNRSSFAQDSQTSQRLAREESPPRHASTPAAPYVARNPT